VNAGRGDGRGGVTRARPVFRPYTFGEEIANSVTHGVGLIASVVGGGLLVFFVAPRGDRVWLAADALYASTLVVLYAASTLYHAVPHPRAKPLLRTLDHSAIYLLIAGTYTPFTLLNLRGPWGWGLCATIWALAALGVAFTAVARHHLSNATTVIYVAMGWLGLIAARPVLGHIAPGGLAWIVAGGLLYTGGIVFYVTDRLRYAHAVWHVFVLGGSICHYVAVLRYAVPG
jgi:hemolysin III